MAKKSRQKFTGQATANQPVVTDDDQDDGVTSIARMQCSGCGKYFVGTRVFDDHRTGDYGGPVYKRSKMISLKVSGRPRLPHAHIRDKGLEGRPRMVPFS